MQALVLDEPGRLRLTTLPASDAPKVGEALVRVHRVGVCGTDYHAFAGNQPFFSYPRILGHELGVEVLEVGAGVTEVRPGDRCAVEPYLNCGRCIACRRGATNCCSQLQVLGVHIDGGLREQFTLPARKLHPSAQLSYDQLALVETLGIGAHAVFRAAPEPDEWALVFGAGPIGLGVTQFAQQAGARVIVADIDAGRLAFVAQHVAVAATVRAGDSALDEIMALTGGDLPTKVFDATGNQGSMQGAFKYVAPSGTLTFVGLFSGDVTFHDPDFHRREITLLASRNARGADFRRIIGLVESGAIDTAPWMTHRASLEAAAETFPTWREPGAGVIKALIEL